MLDAHGATVLSLPPDRQVFEAAASWFVQFQSEAPTQAQRAAWRQWMESDPAHQVAWQQMEQLQQSLGSMPQHLAQRALSRPQQRRQVLKLMIAAVGAGYLGWNVHQHTALKNVLADYRTPVGRRQHVELADGSQVELNTDTAIDVVFDSQQRLIRLRDGEILIRTASQRDTRPFYVETQQGRIQALGTRFSVRQLQTMTRVGVLEDQVSIVPTSGGERLLSAGQGVDFDTRGISPNRSYPQSASAWVEGQLIVLNEPLGNVIHELARYRRGVLQCDEQAATLRVSGTFRLDAADAVLANLQATLPVQVRYFTRYWISVTRTV